MLPVESEGRRGGSHSKVDPDVLRDMAADGGWSMFLAEGVFLAVRPPFAIRCSRLVCAWVQMFVYVCVCVMFGLH